MDDPRISHDDDSDATQSAAAGEDVTAGETDYDDVAGSESESYEVAPLPETFRDAGSPAYRAEPEPITTETYALGPEVDAASYSSGTQSWREAAAGVQRQRDEFDVLDVPLPERRPSWENMTRMLESRTPAVKQVRAGAVEDPARFTLGTLFLIVTAASVALAFGSRLPRATFAGVSGAAAFFTLFAAKWIRRGSATMQMAWYVLLGIYVLASVFAALGL